MQLTNTPGKLVLPFANAGAKNTIPTESQIGITAGAASLTDGFPPLTRTPIAAGGVPPSGLDMNGILYELSAILRWANAGGGYAYDAAFATDPNVGGYPKGARIMRSDGLGYWFNTVENNTTDPEAAGAAAAGWVPDFTNGVTAVTMTSANVTLTPLQYGKPIIVITGTLTANLNLIFPSIAGEWSVINNTTGAYSVTCKTAAGTGVVVNSAQAIVGDGVNIYSAVNDAISLLGKNVAHAAGTADALTAAFTPALHSWPDGVPFFVRAASANTTTTPTFAPDGLTAKTIVKGNNLPLAVGDIAGAGHWLALQYDSALDKWVLQNPAKGFSIVVNDASETVKGLIEIATTAEVQAGTDTVRAVTPAGLAAAGATKLQTARTLTIGNTGKSFDGSANVSWSLAEIGAAGVAYLADGTDLNTVVSPGFYRLGNPHTNTPPNVGHGQLIVARGGGDTILQIVTGYANGEIYWRQGNPPEAGNNNGSWRPWHRFFHSGNLGAASETAQGLVELATAAEAQAGTDGAKALSPLRLRDALNASGSAPIYACRAWVNFNGTGTVAIRASGNVSSITDNGTGDFTVNFTTALPDANYCPQITNNSTAGDATDYKILAASFGSLPTLMSTSRLRIAGPQDSTVVSVAIFR